MTRRMSGYNILPRNNVDLVKLVEHYQRNQPGITVVSHEPHVIERLRAVSPGTIYIYRDSPTGHGTDDDIYDKAQPAAYVDYLHAKAPAGAALYLGNEPNDKSKIADWTGPALERCTQLGRRGVALNLFPGHPERHDWVGVFAPVLRAVSAGNHILGLHEYYGRDQLGFGWWVMRLRWVIDDAPKLGIKPPPIAITELGMLGYQAGETLKLDSGAGWKRTGASDDQYANSLEDVFRYYYSVPQVLGAAVFCIGDWHGCEVDKSPDLLKRMEQHQMPATVIGHDLGKRHETTIRSTPLPQGANIRNEPNASARIIGNLRAGDKIAYWDNPVSNGGLHWLKVEFGEVQGWVADEVVTRADEVTPPPVVEPPALPPPAPPPVVVEPPKPPTDALYSAWLSADELQQLASLHTHIARIYQNAYERGMKVETTTSSAAD